MNFSTASDVCLKMVRRGDEAKGEEEEEEEEGGAEREER